MTALGKLVRSTAFRLTLVYLVIFALYAAALLVYFALNTGRLITEQITETVDDEIAELTEQYTIGSWRQLTTIIENRSRPCDVIRLTHKAGVLHYINLLSFGFVADVCTLANRRFKRLGEVGYLLAVVLCPTAAAGATSSTRGRSAAWLTSASWLTWMPGAMAPPR